MKYKAKGLVYGSYWGGGEGAYKAEEYEADSYEELETKINKGIKDGSIDSGMGYENVLGAVMDIEEIETIEKDGKEYSRSETYVASFGELTEQQSDFTVECLIY